AARLPPAARPTVSANGPYDVNEGAAVAVGATGRDPEGGTVTYAWDLDNNGTFETPGQNVTFSAATLDGPGTRTIRVQATDPGGQTAADSADGEIHNVPQLATFHDPSSAFVWISFSFSVTT